RSSRSDARTGGIGLDGSARANRDWRRHVKGEDHGWLRNCPLMAMLLANSLSCHVVSAHWEPDAIPSTRTRWVHRRFVHGPSRARLMISGGAMAENFEIVTRTDIEFAEHDGTKLVGDLYLPRGLDKAPTLVGVHGGGWQIGDRKFYTHWGSYLAKNGY